MAQSVEHFVHIEGVVGSSPTATTTKNHPLWVVFLWWQLDSNKYPSADVKHRIEDVGSFSLDHYMGTR